MKKILAILLATMLLAGTFAIAAQAAVNFSSVPSSTTISKGFAKRNADFFRKLDLQDPALEFSVDDDSQFAIDRLTGKMTFKGGPGTTFGGPKVTIWLGSTVMKEVEVKVVYEWYEYFVILFAAGYFWIYTINN